MIQIILEAKFNLCYKKLFILFPQNLRWIKKKSVDSFIIKSGFRSQITTSIHYSFSGTIPNTQDQAKQSKSKAKPGMRSSAVHPLQRVTHIEKNEPLWVIRKDQGRMQSEFQAIDAHHFPSGTATAWQPLDFHHPSSCSALSTAKPKFKSQSKVTEKFARKIC